MYELSTETFDGPFIRVPLGKDALWGVNTKLGMVKGWVEKYAALSDDLSLRIALPA